jgi:hypothetical protein
MTGSKVMNFLAERRREAPGRYVEIRSFQDERVNS